MFSNRISNNNGSDDWNRELISVPRLEKMASVSVAIALWNHAIVTIPNLLKADDYEHYLKLNKELSTLKWMCALPVPKSLTEPIERHFCSLSKQVEKWISYIHQEIFLTRGVRSDLYQLIDDIIWHPNGTIHPTETARNLLKSDKLTTAEKFRFACTYCLREDVERIWPMMEDENDLVVPLRFSEYPLHCYWTYYCADQLNEIENLASLSVDEFMISQTYVNNWSAIEYFFDHLDAEERVRQAVSLFDQHGLTYLKFILLKLNGSQRLSVMMDRVVQIIDKCTSYESVSDYENDLIISTWYTARDVITEQQFVDLFSRLLETLTEDFVLTEIWSTTREDLKRHILNYRDYYFIAKLLGWWESQHEKENCPTVISSILMDQVSAHVKREIPKEKFFSKWCEKVIRRGTVNMLDHMINLCLTEKAESTKFKLSLSQSKYFNKHCQKLMIDCETEELARLLEFAFSKTDPSSAQLVHELLNKYSGNLDQRCMDP
ncbi:uncharacterized protein LOC135844398 [Planococcus citri]|uniref:uncharacterized protein LOC135844398 n=1 Tax=Planococcus citri TaxID=170843 RepID=UPI0031FA3B20